MKLDYNTIVFFELVRAGLWADIGFADKRVQVFTEPVNWEKVFRLANEQSVKGLVLQGIERYKNQNADFNIDQIFLLQWIGEMQIIEQQNLAMNEFVAKLIEELREKDIYALLIKGQGIAQCYDRPFWRSSGDVDLLLSEEDYHKASACLAPLASNVEKEHHYNKHQGFIIDSWVVELHGSLRGGLSSRIDRVLDEILGDVFYGGNARSWTNGKTQVFLPGVDCDILYVFSHLLTHFYKEGLGLRQVCDWCRILWTYRDEIDAFLLEKRVQEMGLMSEWKAFGAFAVKYLGMPASAIPLYSANKKCSRKADLICAFILEVGNMGHNRDMSYFEKYPYYIRKAFSLWRRCWDLMRHARIFPMDSLRFFPRIMVNGLRSAMMGE